MVKIFIDGTEYDVPEGLTVLQAAQKVGIEIPHYCYHPGLSIDGNCRMCLVEVEKMPKPQISCNTRVAEGMVVKTKSQKVEEMRKAVMEFLLLNHPLDCPECDQAGECRLQEYYMDYDMQVSHLEEIEKVHKPKMVDLGPNVILDAERCILCTRCVRFTNEISKTGELYIKERGNHSEITTFPGKPLDNPYATNTVDICPVGALTSKDFRFKKRVWFLKTTNSICNGCATGCNIYIDHADAKVYRYRPRFNEDTNQYWICDEGRLGYKRMQEKRIVHAWARKGESLVPVSIGNAMLELRELMSDQDPAQIAIVVSAQQSNENLKTIAHWRNKEFPQSAFYYSERTVHNPSHDAFLINADKNPNTQGVKSLPSALPMAAWNPSIRSAIVFDELSEADATRLGNSKLDHVIVFAHREDALTARATLVLPIPNYWEEDGSFTNAKGRVQRFHKCFDAPGDAREIGRYLKDLAKESDSASEGAQTLYA